MSDSTKRDLATAVLAELDEWDDERFVFYLGQTHGDWGLYRQDRAEAERLGLGPRWFYCDEHNSLIERRYDPVTAAEAIVWLAGRQS
jgi:hypothetical protein